MLIIPNPSTLCPDGVSCISGSPLSPSSRCIPAGHVTYTQARHLVMSLHGRCVTQHPDSLMEITSVFRQAEAATARGVGFPSAIYCAGDFSCGQHSYRAPALRPRTDLMAAEQPALVHALASSTRPSLSLSLGFVPVFLTLYLIHSVYPRFHLKPPSPLTSFPRSLPISPSGLMWDCKWSSLTPIAG